MSYEVIIFYKYTPIENPKGFMEWQRKTCEELGLLGRILIAHEGINGTIEGKSEQIEQYCKQMHAQDGSKNTFGDFSDVWFKSSFGTGNAFKKLKVKVKNEIVNIGLGNEDIDPNKTTGTYLQAEELKKWIENKEEFEIIDMRNEYEYEVGHFKKSLNSGLRHFRFLKSVLPRFEYLKNKKVLTVCTYGVRCEKASGYLKQQGFKDVYQLHGGIGTYMKKYPGQDFVGSLYVFDERMTEQFTHTYEVVGTCVVCHQKSERFGNCAYNRCHKQLIICEGCRSEKIFCSEKCRENN